MPSTEASHVQVDALFKHRVQALVNPLYFLLKDAQKIEDSHSPFDKRPKSLDQHSAEKLFSVSQSSIHPSGMVTPNELLVDDDLICNQKVHEKAKAPQLTSHICIEEQILLCGKCAYKHSREGHNTMPINQCVNKTRSILTMLSEKMENLM